MDQTNQTYKHITIPIYTQKTKAKTHIQRLHTGCVLRPIEGKEDGKRGVHGKASHVGDEHSESDGGWVTSAPGCQGV